MNERKPLVGWILVVALALTAGACSLRYDFTECKTDGDCVQIEQPADGQFYQCVQNKCVLDQTRECRTAAECGAAEDCVSGRCQAISPPGDAGDVQDVADAGDADQSQDTGDGGAADATDASASACDSTQQCIDNFGDSYYCAPWGECVDTASPECDDIYYPDNERGDIVILGSIIPTQGVAYQGIGATVDNGVRMAVIQYAANAFTLPSGQTVAYLHCQGGSSQTAKAAARHLKDIGVPIVVGPLTSSTFLDVVRDVTEADDNGDGVYDNPMGAIAIGATSPAIGNLDSAGKHSFQIISNDRFQTTAMVDRTHDLRWRSCVQQSGDSECTDDASCQAHFGADYTFDSTKPNTPCKDGDPQIAVFYKDDQYGRDFQNLLITRYANRYSDATVKYYKYANPADLGFDPTRMGQEFANVISSSLQGSDALPTADLVLFIGTGETSSLAKGYIGAIAQAGIPPSSKRYIFSHGGAADAPNMFSGDQALSADLMGNVEAVAPNIFNGDYYKSWYQHYSLTFGEPEQTSVAGLAYDAAYMAIFAMAGVPAGQPLNAANVTKVIADGRLQNADTGTQIVLDNSTISFEHDAREALKNGGDIDMVGVSGNLDFEFANGENQGTVRSNYLGLDIRQQPNSPTSNPVYEGVPTRIYVLADGETFGQWAPIPPSP